ncbi:hypothetical protein LZ31DRAFT_554262 [Colletotrichum somersetense]|nr:hypothetical protein LZ31DRAFT_554262 [Colletotrichum somersetense]
MDDRPASPSLGRSGSRPAPNRNTDRREKRANDTDCTELWTGGGPGNRRCSEI